MSVSAKEKFLALVAESLRDGAFVKLSLSGYRGADHSLRRVLVRPVQLRAGARLSFVYRHATRDVTKNLPHEEGLALLGELIGMDFRGAHLVTSTRAVQLEFSEGARARLTETAPPTAPAGSPQHDREKQRSITPEGAPWLRALGVTTTEGKVTKGMEPKFRQINRFVELLQHLLADSSLRPGDPLRMVDMGCGKGYLTFAAHDWLRRSGWPGAQVCGVEARAELAELCNRVAQENHFAGLRFVVGTIASAPLDHVDVLIALHACDTATDDAIARGVETGASLIVVAPCCHQELRPRLNPPAVLAGALRHGILLEREAEFVTDALRAALLEWAGYDAKVFEFISTEHTSKNLMIAAIKRARPANRIEAERRVKEFAAFYGITAQRLAAQLGLALM